MAEGGAWRDACNDGAEMQTCVPNGLHVQARLQRVGTVQIKAEGRFPF